MVHILRIIVAFTVSCLCIAGHAAETYNYSYTFAGGIKVTGSFQGDGNIHHITNLSNITAFISDSPASSSLTDEPFHGNGNLFASSFDANGDPVSGGAVLSDMLADNNFLFSNSDYPIGPIPIDFNYFALDGRSGGMAGYFDINTAGDLGDVRWSLTPAGPAGDPGSVPEPASLALLTAGIAVLATTRRKRGLIKAGK